MSYSGKLPERLRPPRIMERRFRKATPRTCLVNVYIHIYIYIYSLSNSRTYRGWLPRRAIPQRYWETESIDVNQLTTILHSRLSLPATLAFAFQSIAFSFKHELLRTTAAALPSNAARLFSERQACRRCCYQQIYLLPTSRASWGEHGNYYLIESNGRNKKN